jgi:WD40 repeat protein
VEPPPTAKEAAAVSSSSGVSSAVFAAPGSASAHPSTAIPAAPPPANIAVDDEASVPLLAWRPNGKSFAVARGKEVAILPRVSGPSIKLPLQRDSVVALRFAPKGDRLATVVRGGEVSIWKVSTGELLGELPEKLGDEVAALVFSPDGSLVAGAGGSSIRIWSVEEKRVRCASGLRLFDLAFTPDQGSLVATGAGDMARLDSVTCEEKARNGADTGGTFGSYVASDGLHVAAAGGDGHKLQLYGGRDFRPIEVLAQSFGCQDHVSASFSRDGKVLLASGGHMWRRSFRLESRKSISAYDVPSPETVSFILAFDDGVRLLVAREARAEIVHAEEKRVALSFGLEGAATFDLSWDNEHLLGASTTQAFIWNTRTGRLERTIELAP